MGAVDATDAAGGEKADPRHRGHAHRGGDRDRTCSAPNYQWPEVARAHLHRSGGDALEVGVAQPDSQLAVQHRHRRGNGALLPDCVLAASRRLQVVGGGKALAHDRGLESHHRPAPRERGRHLWRNFEEVAQLGRAPARVTDCDAAWTARSAASIGVAPWSQALQKAAAKASPAPVGRRRRNLRRPT